MEGPDLEDITIKKELQQFTSVDREHWKGINFDLVPIVKIERLNLQEQQKKVIQKTLVQPKSSCSLVQKEQILLYISSNDFQSEKTQEIQDIPLTSVDTHEQQNKVVSKTFIHPTTCPIQSEHILPHTPSNDFQPEGKHEAEDLPSLNFEKQQNKVVPETLIHPKPSFSQVWDEQILPDVPNNDFQPEGTHEVEDKPSFDLHEQHSSVVLQNVIQLKPSCSPVHNEHILPDIPSNDFQLEETHKVEHIPSLDVDKQQNKVVLETSILPKPNCSHLQDEQILPDVPINDFQPEGIHENAVQTVGPVTRSLRAATPMPQYSYLKMVSLAILSTPNKRNTLNGILNFLLKHFPLCRIKKKLKSTVSDYLCRSKYFVRLIILEGSAQHYWSLAPAVEKKLTIHLNQTGMLSLVKEIPNSEDFKIKELQRFTSVGSENGRDIKLDLMPIVKVVRLDLDEKQNTKVKTLVPPKSSCSLVENEHILPDLSSNGFLPEETPEDEKKYSLDLDEQQNNAGVELSLRLEKRSPVHNKQILPDVPSNVFQPEETHEVENHHDLSPGSHYGQVIATNNHITEKKTYDDVSDHRDLREFSEESNSALLAGTEHQNKNKIQKGPHQEIQKIENLSPSKEIAYPERKAKLRAYACENCGTIFTSIKSSVRQCCDCLKKAQEAGSLQKTHSRKLNCEQCGKTFSCESKFHDHLDSHSTIKRHICRVCGKAYKSRDGLIYHEHKIHFVHSTYFKQISKLRGYACEECSTVFKRTKSLIRQCSDCVKKGYKINTLQITQSQKFVCDKCGRIFPKRYIFLRHLDTHSTIKRHICLVCGKAYRSRYSLSRHSLSRHLDTHSTIKRHICLVCHKAFGSLRTLKFHQKNVHSRETHKCTKCNNVYKYAHALRSHEYRKHRNVYSKECWVCDICNKMFKNKYGLSRHKILKHSELNAYICNDCPATYNLKDKLINHITSKHMTPTVKCSMCPKLLHTKKQLETHMRLQHFIENRKMFICEICGKTTRSKYGLENHHRIHTDEMPYVCEDCGKRFRTISNLHQHAKIHTNIRLLTCHICQKSFRIKHHLKQHMAVHGMVSTPKYGRRRCLPDLKYGKKRKYMNNSSSSSDSE